MGNGNIEISPYINFHGRAREAMEFYQRVLGGKVELQPMKEPGSSRPAGPDDRITLARLTSDGAVIVGTDGHPKYAPTVGDNMAVALRGSDRDRMTRIFEGLAEGGKVKGRITPQPGGASTGYLVDKFGINWVVSVSQI